MYTYGNLSNFETLKTNFDEADGLGISQVFDIIVNSLRTCSLGPRLQSGLSAGIDLTNSIHFWPNLEKKKSLDGISMGRHSGCS